MINFVPLVLFVIFTPAQVLAITISDELTCKTIGGTLTRNVCSLALTVINSNQKITVASEIEISIPANVTVFNFGSITNSGNFSNNGLFKNFGTINNNGTLKNNGIISNDGQIINVGTIHDDQDFITTLVSNFQNYGTLYNKGLINGDAVLENSGTINNLPKAVLGNDEGEIENNLGASINNYGYLLNDLNNIVKNQGAIDNLCKSIFNNSGKFSGNSIFSLC